MGVDTSIEEREIKGIDKPQELLKYEKEASKDLREVLERGKIKLEDLIAVRQIFKGHLDIDEKEGVMYASPFRPTLHFSLDHMFDLGGHKMYGDWSDISEVILIPFKDLIEKSKDTFYGGTTVDSFFVGFMKLPDDYKIIKRHKGETYDELKVRVDKAIKEMGYKVMPSGSWDWGDSSVKAYEGLMEELGYSWKHHHDTVFRKTEFKISDIVESILDAYKSRDFGSIDDLDTYYQHEPLLDRLRKRFMSDEYSSFGIDMPKDKDGKIIYDLGGFYQTMKKESIDVESFTKWLYKKITEKQDFEFSDKYKISSGFYRVMFYDILTDVAKYKEHEARQELKDKIREAKELRQMEDKRPYHRIMYEDIPRIRKQIKEYSTILDRFRYPITKWISYWGKK